MDESQSPLYFTDVIGRVAKQRDHRLAVLVAANMTLEFQVVDSHRGDAILGFQGTQKLRESGEILGNF